jgi:hypothetical protein
VRARRDDLAASARVVAVSPYKWSARRVDAIVKGHVDAAIRDVHVAARIRLQDKYSFVAQNG